MKRSLLLVAAAIAILGIGLMLGRAMREPLPAPHAMPRLPEAQAPEAAPPGPAVVHNDGTVEPVAPVTGAATPLGHEGLVEVRIRDQDHKPIPARLTFVGERGTPTPRFTTVDIGREDLGAISAFDRAFVIRGDATLRVAPGHYHVWVGHGPEWDDALVPIDVVAGATAHVDVTLHHVIDTPGWISGDFHVHAQQSYDSKVPMRDRVAQFLADGVDLIVSADHNVVADYGPVISDLGVRDLIASQPGDEITTKDWGHFGAFPLDVDNEEAGHGAPPVAGKTPAEIFQEVRDTEPQAVIDIHHPRLENGKIGYFHLAELDPKTLIAKRPGYSDNFDAIEVLNGFQDAQRETIDAVLTDWFAFLRHGKRVTAMGNSDSHTLWQNLGGYPRTYLRVDFAKANDPDAIAAAVREGHAFFTTGPIVDLDIGGAGPGDTATLDGPKAKVHVRVRAPRWMDVARVLILIDGTVVAKWRVSGNAIVRFERTIALAAKPGQFVVVRVDGDRPMAPLVGDAGLWKVYPLAVTNPVWLSARE